ncbi:hypothetical protein E2C01_036371 [Portunus trituberculatus]|uniref:Uncharacterized protein n=1 Tax=Portunus trituberculatus TaxID=210409 RepID=A0A5B7F6J3_PORTR|nr:hypothetical protein [Portunus trituberculatus]
MKTCHGTEGVNKDFTSLTGCSESCVEVVWKVFSLFCTGTHFYHEFYV